MDFLLGVLGLLLLVVVVGRVIRQVVDVLRGGADGGDE
jgi:hypothetical protein